MRIVIDLQGAQCESRNRGIGRYTMDLAKAMVRQRGGHEIILVLNGLFRDTIEPICREFTGLLTPENIRVWHAAGPLHSFDSANMWRRQTAQILREAFIASLNPDVVHITSMFDGFADDTVHSIGLSPSRMKCVATFYDVIPLIERDVYLTPYPLFQKSFSEKLNYMRKADSFLAISESSRLEAIKYLQVDMGRVVSVGAAVSGGFKPIDIPKPDKFSLYQKFRISRPFLMYSGGADDRKNHMRLIEAYASLDRHLRDQFQLVLVGGLPDSHREKFEACIGGIGLTTDDVVITGRVTDAELVQFYNLCHLYVFPSWHEGFGLPALEAMSCGAPVIGSNTTSVPEVIGRNDALFDPLDAQAIAAKITEVLRNDEFRADLSRHGLERAKCFSWDKSAALAISSLDGWYGTSAVAGDELASEVIVKNWAEWAVEQIAEIRAPSRNEDLLRTARSIVHNHPVKTRPEATSECFQLLVDISELVQRDSRTGIQRVCRSILLELIKNPPDGFVVEPVYATMDAHGYKYARRFADRFLRGSEGVQRPEEDVSFYAGDVFLGLDLQHHVVLTQSLYYQDLRRAGVKVAFVLYDLLPVLRREFFPKELYYFHERWLETITQADQVVCISETVSLELRDWLAKRSYETSASLDVKWFHMGSDFLSIPTTGIPSNSKLVFRNLQRRPTFLLVSTIEPRKGHRQVFEAFKLLWAQCVDVNLVFVGKVGWHMADLITKIQLSREFDRQLFWLNGVSDEYLEKIYGASTCLIAASEGEGFGLPLIEAAQHNIPIIARDIPVFKEVAGPHAHYFQGNTPQDLTTSILQWLKLYKLAEHPNSSWIKRLTWEESAKMLMQQILPANKGGTGLNPDDYLNER